VVHGRLRKVTKAIGAYYRTATTTQTGNARVPQTGILALEARVRKSGSSCCTGLAVGNPWEHTAQLRGPVKGHGLNAGRRLAEFVVYRMSGGACYVAR